MNLLGCDFMSLHTIHILSESPDLLIELELAPGTHARIGASPAAEITLPLGGIPPFSCILGRFHDGRLFIANLDNSIARRIDLPATLSLPPYDFLIFQPEIETENPAPSLVIAPPVKTSTLLRRLKLVLSNFHPTTSSPAVSPIHENPPQP